MRKRRVLIPPVRSLSELRTFARGDPRYEKLAITAAMNLGGADITSLEKAMSWLLLNASETSDDGVVEEVNHVRDLI